MNDDYDVVIDVLQKHHDKLMAMVNQNLRSEFIGLNIMDDIRLEQCEQLKLAISMWKSQKTTSNE